MIKIETSRYEQKRIRAVRARQGGNVGDRQILRGTKMSRRFFIIARERSGLFGEANGARPSIIDEGFLREEKDKGNSNCGYARQRGSVTDG